MYANYVLLRLIKACILLFIESRVPKEGPIAAARKLHFKTRGEVPRSPPREEFLRLIQSQSCGAASQAFLK